MNICEGCDKPTKMKETWGIAYCRSCIQRYKEASNRALKELISENQKQYDSILDKKITEVFNENE